MEDSGDEGRRQGGREGGGTAGGADQHGGTAGGADQRGGADGGADQRGTADGGAAHVAERGGAAHAAERGGDDQAAVAPVSFDWAAHRAKAEARLAADRSSVPPFWAKKYRDQAAKNWNDFYRRNSTNFFKDRHWTWREFPELLTETGPRPGVAPTLLEVGCGVGNFVFPLLEQNKAVRVYACDFAKHAVELVKANTLYDPERCTAFVCDLTRDELAVTVPAGTLDLVTMIFVLSAIPPEATVAALRNVANVLAPGGLILFRDYGLHDQAQLRFGPGHRLEDQLYVRQDGTLALYFDKDWLAARVAEAGLEVVDMEYYVRETTNRKLDLHVDRIFVQGRFRRPTVHT